MARHTLDGGRKVFGRHVQSLGIVAYIPFCTTDACREQCHELFYDIGRAVGMCICGIALGMSREVADAGWHGNDHQIVPDDVIAPLVEHKTALASRAEQVHTSVSSQPQWHCLHRRHAVAAQSKRKL